MSTLPTSISGLLGYLRNKSAAILLLGFSLITYLQIPDGSPFTEFVYTIVGVQFIMVVAPLMRVLVFSESAAYAESGGLDADLKSGKFTPALAHYWFATTLCYLAAIASFATITK